MSKNCHKWHFCDAMYWKTIDVEATMIARDLEDVKRLGEPKCD